MKTLIAAAALMLAGLPALAAEQASADFVDREGKPVGKATLVEGPTGVLIQLDLRGLPPGPHGIHLHAVGTCDDRQDGFQASNGHVNPQERKHGLLNPEGPDAGDLPNLFVHQDGTAQAEMFTTRASLRGAEGRGHLLGPNGSAIVIHEKRDDHSAQPIGGAGARIACGVVNGG